MNTEISQINVQILKKFNQPGPRYTSYPTAPLFSSEFTSENFTSEIAATNLAENTSDISLYLHFPFCEKLCYYCGCNMKVTRDRNDIRQYNEYLKREISLLLPLISRKRKVAQMHWGGGTPSYLFPEEIRDIGNFIKKNFEFAPAAEISVEINPGGLTRKHLEAFRASGFNRISVGVQDFDSKVQKAINRIQPEEETRQAIDWARELGFESINVDLIYGLPHQSVESFAPTVEKIIEISPERIAVFNYAHVPWLKKHQNLINAVDLPSTDERLRILQMTIEKLIGAGYEYIGMDHFAKKTDELATAQKNSTLYRNFQGYSTKAGCDVYGFGVSAISQFENIYAQNAKNIKDYYSRIDNAQAATTVGYEMTADDHIRKETIMQLMCHLEINKKSIEERFNINFDEYFAADLPKLAVFITDGLLENKAGKIKILGAGKMVIRNIAMCFDAYLPKMLKENPIFSKTV